MSPICVQKYLRFWSEPARVSTHRQMREAFVLPLFKAKPGLFWEKPNDSVTPQ